MSLTSTTDLILVSCAQSLTSLMEREYLCVLFDNFLGSGRWTLHRCQETTDYCKLFSMCFDCLGCSSVLD